jgi:hypothetical protein
MMSDDDSPGTQHLDPQHIFRSRFDFLFCSHLDFMCRKGTLYETNRNRNNAHKTRHATCVRYGG